MPTQVILHMLWSVTTPSLSNLKTSLIYKNNKLTFVTLETENLGRQKIKI